MDHPLSTMTYFVNKRYSSGSYEHFLPLAWVELPFLPIAGHKFLCIHWAHCYSFDSMYSESAIPKRSGGTRLIENPHPTLKNHQSHLMEYLYKVAPVHESCHGFRKGCSIKTNALPHVAQENVINLDLKDFFPSISSKRIFNMFTSLGFHRSSETIKYATSLVTRNDHLPQGAPSSPLIANIICFNMDEKLSNLVKSENGVYTRYADDLTFSGGSSIQRMLPKIRQIIESEGFTVNESKTRIRHKTKRQEVTGLTVNEKVTIPRHLRKKLRAAIHHKVMGLQPTWNGRELSDDALQGHIDYLTSIHPEYKGKYSFPCKGGYSVKGFNCNGYNQNAYDKNGYNPFGFDSSGYDKDGFDKKGFNQQGYNREGINGKGILKPIFFEEENDDVDEIEDLDNSLRWPKNGDDDINEPWANLDGSPWDEDR